MPRWPNAPKCVMLNKGPFLVEGIATLADVLARMQTHQSKETPQLRALKAWTENRAPILA